MGMIAFLPMFLRGISFLPGLVQGIEGLFAGKTGAEKRHAAVQLVGSAIDVADAVEGKQIVDADGFTAGLGMIVDGVVACLNASIWHKA